jgi:hypothetical protein
MERLTAEGTNGQLYACGMSLCSDGEILCSNCPYQKEANARLAAYENTGLTPERVAELAEADRDKRLMVMPCRIIKGTTVYVPGMLSQRIETAEITGVSILTDQGFMSLMRYGETWFATRAEAEAAQERMKIKS